MRWIPGAGLATAGLISLSFISLPVGLLIIGAGVVIATGCELQAEKQAARAARMARSNYPSYKY